MCAGAPHSAQNTFLRRGGGQLGRGCSENTTEDCIEHGTRLSAKWGGTGLFGELMLSGKCASAPSVVPPTPSAPPFARLISRGASLVDRVSREAITFMLADGALEMRVNNVFAKRISVLRIHRPSSHIYDQHDWTVAAPHHQFARLEKKLRALAERAGIPAFQVMASTAYGGAYEHSGATRSFTSVTLEMPSGTGTLCLSWSRPTGDVKEVIEVWSAASAGIKGAQVLAGNSGVASATACSLLRAVAVWIASRASSVFIVVDAASVEGQIVATEVWPVLQPTGRSAIIVVPTVPVSTGNGVSHFGAIASFSAAHVLHKLLIVAQGRDCTRPPPLAFVDSGCWPEAAGNLMPLLREQLASSGSATESQLVCFPSGTLASIHGLLTQLWTAYCDSRPYMHALIGAGGLEADIREALEGATCSLCRLLEDPGALSYSSAGVTLLEHTALHRPTQSGLSPLLHFELPAAAAPMKVLVPVGCGAYPLARLAEDQLGGRWRIGVLSDRVECMVLLDLTDTASARWLQCEKDRAEGSASLLSVHVLALLPGTTAGRPEWDDVAAPLATLTSGDALDLGLGLFVSLGDCCATNVVGLLDALGDLHLHDIAFQLRPRPRASFAIPACARTVGVEGDKLFTTTGSDVLHGDVLASFSLWPAPLSSCSGYDVDNHAVIREPEEARLLDVRFLTPGLPTAIVRAGSAYVSSGLPGGKFSWHLCACETIELEVYRRAAGDFDGRACGEFHWFGGDEGPQAVLWELVAELQGGIPEFSCAEGGGVDGVDAEGASLKGSERHGQQDEQEESASYGEDRFEESASYGEDRIERASAESGASQGSGGSGTLES